jgi:hypothetical protein
VLISKPPTDIFGEVSALRVGGEEIAVLLGREIEIGIDFAATKKQVKGMLVRCVFRGTEDAGIQTPPVHGSHLSYFRSSPTGEQVAECNIGEHRSFDNGTEVRMPRKEKSPG